MPSIVSALVYTLIDQGGNPRQEAWFTCQFGEAYQPGGIAFDLSPYLKRIEHVSTEWMSGGALRAPISGVGIFSGAAFQSGGQVKALPVFEDYDTPASARFMLQSVLVHALVSGTTGLGGLQEIGSGLAASGVRFLARALGY